MRSSLLVSCLLLAGTQAANVGVQLNMSWFPASGPNDDCSTVPASVTVGPLTDDVCVGASAGAKLCACASRLPGLGEQTLPTKYVRVCGKCSDPCALHFHADHSPVDTGDDSTNQIS